ncbi:MAG: Uma2 family endonuclease [Saprospiraceae bacterium]|nr:Uma2 family endonuclease [Saprospiraceae bacterium]
MTEHSAPRHTTIVRTGIPLRPKRHLPKTFEERAELGVRELRVPATFDEYLRFALACEYRLHYREGHIISFIEIEEKTGTVMGEASVSHEALVIRIGRLLDELLENRTPAHHVLGSNTRIFIAQDRKGINADVTVVRGQVEQLSYKYNKRQVTGISNPWLIVEVLSESTRDFDLSEKLSDYKQIASLQQIIFIEQNSAGVTTYIRTGANEWRNLDFFSLNDNLPIEDKEISLRRIYDRIIRTE